VVDAFDTIQAELETQAVDEPPPDALDRLTQAARELHGRDADPAPLALDLRLHATDTVLRLYDHLARLGPAVSLADTCDLVTRYVRRLAPAGLVVIFTRDERTEDLSVTAASGFGEALFAGLTIPMGTRVSGWAASNRRSVLNADPLLDLGDTVSILTPALRSVLSVPLISDRTVVGAVSLYSVQAQAFTDDHRQAVELIAGPVADVVRAASALDATAGLAGPPAVSPTSRLDPLLHGGAFWAPTSRRSLGVLYVRTAGDALAMTHTSVAVNQATRIADLIVCLQPDELVVLMPGADSGAGRVVIDRMAEALAALPGGAALCAAVRVGFACGPTDGPSVRDLLAVARRRVEADEAAPRAVTPDPDVVAVQGGGSWPA
jgi:putative methionine-R-sulfoxide reductase with GAF domain